MSVSAEAKLKLQCGGNGWIKSAAKRAIGFGVSASVLFSVFWDSPQVLAESLTVAFPVSRAPEVINSTLLLGGCVLVKLNFLVV